MIFFRQPLDLFFKCGHGDDLITHEIDFFYGLFQSGEDGCFFGVPYNRSQWNKEARYQYYLHGPFARTILGQQNVQGIDYAYTLQGWLKGVNSQHLNPGRDNISQATYAIGLLNNGETVGNSYQYDQLNRLLRVNDRLYHKIDHSTV
ncbi:hypothetical protein [Flavihumibacter sp. UBA7668]|uniref:hypothetical protein n=1 Tax=Flavihumibacter sp. UBA7668 TaxID=1946542 RepID=UPI0025C6B45D|nr:hypothetical protein [Flavihumibacter sp. UBA7668]